MGYFRNITIDDTTGSATFAREYSKMETVLVTEKMKNFTTAIPKSLKSLPMGEVIPFLNYVAEKKDLRLNRENEYKQVEFELMELINRN